MPERKRVAIYARVSTADQTAENQLLDLRGECARRGWTVVQEFVDLGLSGAKADRPALLELMEAVRKRRVDCVFVWRFDRFARSTSHLVASLELFRHRNIDFASYSENIDTTTSYGKMLFTIFAALAEFERAVIIERINAGLRRARSCKRCGQQQHDCRCTHYIPSKILGRPRKISDDKIREILGSRGEPVRKIAARVGLSKSLVQIVLSKKPGQKVASVIDEMPVAFRRVQ
jgi:DNA invertase Pin-like site-specific DNA recombinase